MAKRDLNQSSTARVTKVPDTRNEYTIRIGTWEEYMTVVQYYSSRREKLTAKWKKSWVISELEKFIQDKRRAEEEAEEDEDKEEEGGNETLLDVITLYIDKTSFRPGQI
jgi:hypothetical protein